MGWRGSAEALAVLHERAYLLLAALAAPLSGLGAYGGELDFAVLAVIRAGMAAIFPPILWPGRFYSGFAIGGDAVGASQGSAPRPRSRGSPLAAPATAASRPSPALPSAWPSHASRAAGRAALRGGIRRAVAERGQVEIRPTPGQRRGHGRIAARPRPAGCGMQPWSRNRPVVQPGRPASNRREPQVTSCRQSGDRGAPRLLANGRIAGSACRRAVHQTRVVEARS